MLKFALKLIISLIAFSVTSCMTVAVPVVEAIDPDSKPTEQETTSLKSWNKLSAHISDQWNPPAPNSVSMPKAGDKNSYSVDVDENLGKAYSYYTSGEAELALMALQRFDSVSKSDERSRWYSQFFRAQVLIMMGLSAEAEMLLNSSTMILEQQVFGTLVNTLALRGEARIWLNDFKGARRDFTKVLHGTRNWRLPVSYSAPPSNLAEMFDLTTAQLRALTGMAIINMLEGKMPKARLWAELAEERFSDVHYVADHPIYSQVMSVHADSFYGRAINLAILGAVSSYEKQQAIANQYFQASSAYFDAIGFKAGKAIVKAFHAFALNESQQYQQALKISAEALILAKQLGLNELIWQIGTISGIAQYELGHLTEAEIAFRQAQQAVLISSGDLSTDSLKRRFGTGKEDITYYLAQIDISNRNYAQLFSDLEQGRARAFVDSLAGRQVHMGKVPKLIKEIRKLDRQIKKMRLKNISISGNKSQNLILEKQLLSQRAKAVVKLETLDPERAQTLAITTQPLSRIQKNLKKGQIMVYALPERNDQALQLMLIAKDNARLLTLSSNASQLKLKLEQFRKTIFDTNDKQQKQLLKQIEQLLSLDKWGATEALFIVPAGVFHHVPWGIFDLNIPVAVLPTGGWITRNRAANRLKSIAIVGDPYYFGQLPQLDGALAEAKMIAQLYATAPITGKQATEKMLRQQIGAGVGILHLATHGLFDVEQPLNSALMLAGETELDVLTADEIYQRPLNADLVILSACESGMGKSIAGEDYLGLPRSFYLGGAQTILYSMWPIEDQGTSLFMKTFHQLAKNGNYGTAYLAARAKLKENNYPPSIYGAFVLGGALNFK